MDCTGLGFEPSLSILIIFFLFISVVEVYSVNKLKSFKTSKLKYKKAVYTTTRVCLYHPATRMWLYPKPGILDTATRLMTAQSKGCTAMLLGQDSKYSLTE